MKTSFKHLLGGIFVIAGILHFVLPYLYVAIMPPYLPWHLFLVYLSGGFEILLGALLFFPQCARPARWALIGLLVAILPANLHMALHPDLYPSFSPMVLWLRLPLQVVLMAWVYWCTSPKQELTLHPRTDPLRDA